MTEREATAVLASTSAAWIQGALRRGRGTVPLPLLSLASTSETARPSFLLASDIDLISLSGLSLLLSTQFLKLSPPPREWPRKRVKGPVGQNVLDDCHFLCDPGQGTFPTCKMWGWHPLKGLLWGHKGVTWGRAMPGIWRSARAPERYFLLKGVVMMSWWYLGSVQFCTYLHGGLCCRASVSSFVKQDINSYSPGLLSELLSESSALRRCQSNNAVLVLLKDFISKHRELQ